MTREEIEALEGRELDAAVARVVFGLQPVYVAEKPLEFREDPDMPFGVQCNFGGAVWVAEREWVVNDYVLPCSDGGLDGGHILPHYSGSLDEAWKVVLQMAHLGYGMELHEFLVCPGHEHKPFTSISFGRDRIDHALNRYGYVGPVPVAICRAALIARCGEASADADV
ncbi:MAG TPA: hypothetical protein VIK99_00410 [Thermaerobacter sp.]